MVTTTQPGHGQMMDRVYRYQRHIYNLTRKYYLLGRDLLIDDLDLGTNGAMLEVGCGTARNLIKAAKRYPDARFFGVDISEEMLATARASIARHGLSDRIRVEKGDATNFDGAALFGQPTFDRIIYSYSLSMIPSWRATLERGAGALAPGGSLMIIDFGDLAGWPAWSRNMLRWWLARFHVTPRVELAEDARRLAQASRFSIDIRKLHRGYSQYITFERPARA